MNVEPLSLPAILPRPESTHPPLSYQQLGWLEAQDAGMVGHVDRCGVQSSNLHVALRVRGRLDLDVLQRSADELVRRHALLRTTLVTRNGESSGLVASHAEAPIHVVELAHAVRDREELARRRAAEMTLAPFDYCHDAMLRVVAVRMAADDHLVAIVMPHLVSDGRSLDLCLRDLVAVYSAFVQHAAPPPPDTALQYADFAAWQRRWLEEEVRHAVARYYVAHLAAAPTLDVPTDRPRPIGRDFSAADHSFDIADAGVARAIRRVAWQLRVTPPVVVLASLAALLACWSGRDDVLLATLLAGRIQSPLPQLIGFFPCFAFLRIQFADRPPFPRIVERVERSLADARVMEGVPYGFFERLARHRARLPELSVCVNVLTGDADEQAFTLGGARATRVPLDLPPDLATPLSRHELSLLLSYDRSGTLAGRLRYRTQLFTASTARQLARRLTAVVRAAAAQPGPSFDDIAALARAHQHSAGGDGR